MKKAIAFLLSLAILMSFLIAPVSAAEDTFDKLRRYVDEKNLSKLEGVLDAGDEAVGVLYYADSFWDLCGGPFSGYQTFNQMLLKQKEFWFIIQKQNGEIRWGASYTAGYLSFLEVLNRDGVVLAVQDLTATPEKVFAHIPELGEELPALCVFSVGSEGQAVYLESETQGYVYWTNNNDDKEYLFPADTFMKYAMWSMMGLSFFWDLSVYDINSSRFNLDAPLTGPINLCICIVVILVAVALVIFYFRMRKKRLAQKVSAWQDEQA